MRTHHGISLVAVSDVLPALPVSSLLRISQHDEVGSGHLVGDLERHRHVKRRGNDKGSRRELIDGDCFWWTRVLITNSSYRGPWRKIQRTAISWCKSSSRSKRPRCRNDLRALSDKQLKVRRRPAWAVWRDIARSWCSKRREMSPAEFEGGRLNPAVMSLEAPQWCPALPCPLIQMRCPWCLELRSGTERSFTVQLPLTGVQVRRYSLPCSCFRPILHMPGAGTSGTSRSVPQDARNSNATSRHKQAQVQARGSQTLGHLESHSAKLVMIGTIFFFFFSISLIRAPSFRITMQPGQSPCCLRCEVIGDCEEC